MAIRTRDSKTESQNGMDAKKDKCPFDATTLRNIEAVERMSEHPLTHEQLLRQVEQDERGQEFMALRQKTNASDCGHGPEK